mgnify:CR=1 FL=1
MRRVDLLAALRRDHVQGMKHAGNPAEDGETRVDSKVLCGALLEVNSKRRDDEGADVEDGVRDKAHFDGWCWCWYWMTVLQGESDLG